MAFVSDHLSKMYSLCNMFRAYVSVANDLKNRPRELNMSHGAELTLKIVF